MKNKYVNLGEFLIELVSKPNGTASEEYKGLVKIYGIGYLEKLLGEAKAKREQKTTWVDGRAKAAGESQGEAK